MTAAVETMAYNKAQKPWHGMGVPVSDDFSPEQIMQVAGLNWTVSKQPTFYQKDGKMERITDKFALVRNTDKAILSAVGSNYKPVQNAEGIDFFKKFVAASHMTLETAGSMWGGRCVWILANINKTAALGRKKDDEIRSHLLLALPHIHGKSVLFKFNATRVACWNMWTTNLGKHGHSFRVPHSTVFNEHVKARAEMALGLAQSQMDEFAEAAVMLTKAKVALADTEQFFRDVLRYDPSKVNKKKNDDPREPNMLPKLRMALEHAPGQQMDSAAGTMWGAFNAVTYVVDHETGRSRDTALKSIWLGAMADMKKRALDLAIDRAKTLH